MKIARFLANGQELFGLVEDSYIRVISSNIFGDFTATEEVFPIADIELLVPVKPSKIIGIGLNYKAVAQAKGVEFPPEPILFLKPPSSLIGPGEAVVVPELVKKPSFEVELAIVIGKQAKNVSEAEALDYCLGYTLANDITAKDHMVKGQPWTKGKSFDTFTPIGPYIVTDVDPDSVEIAFLLNGEEKQRSSTADMIFNCRQLVAFVSQVMTLEPGDIILTGTPAGGGDFSRNDGLTLLSPQLGAMTNPVC